MVSGDPAAVERVRPLTSLWGNTLTVAGDKPGAAQLLKLTNNILFAVSLAATSEAFAMGAKGGLDPEVMIKAINAGSGRNGATFTVVPPVLGIVFLDDRPSDPLRFRPIAPEQNRATGRMPQIGETRRAERLGRQFGNWGPRENSLHLIAGHCERL